MIGRNFTITSAGNFSEQIQKIRPIIPLRSWKIVIKPKKTSFSYDVNDHDYSKSKGRIIKANLS